MKHALAREDAAGVDTVKSAGERAFLPGLDTMRVARTMQCDVGVDDLRLDPRPVLIGARRLRACLDDVLERAVDRECVRRRSRRLLHAAPDMQMSNQDH